MSFPRCSSPDFKAPYRSDDIEESCELASEYYSSLVDGFVAKLPEHRQPLEFVDWLADAHSWSEKIQLIFPNGFGEYDEDRNHNPMVWPVLLELSNAVRDGTTDAFARELCDSWRESFTEDGQSQSQIQLVQRIFDYLTAYLQCFVTFTDTEGNDLDFKYPPEDEAGNLVGSVFRNQRL